jgi:integrase
MGDQLAFGEACPGRDCVRLRKELAEARLQVVQLTQVAKDQAKALAELTDDCPPWAPSVAILYWIYGPTRWADPNWPRIWNRLVPIVDAHGDLPAAKLTPVIWDTHRARRKQTAKGRYGEPIADSCLNMELVRAKEMLNWAVANKYIKANPLVAAKPVPTVAHRDTRLTPEQLEGLLAACDDVVDRRFKDGDDDGLRSVVLKAYALCLHDSMLRPNEARGLRRAGVQVDKASGFGRVELAARGTKTRKHRAIFLTPRTLEAIALLPVDDATPYVFSEGGKQLHERRLRYWFRRACELAGVDVYAAPGERQIRPHDLRASGATTADERGARATAVRDALGHALLATTEKYLRSEQAMNARTVADVMVEATDQRRGPRRAVSRAIRKYAVVER